MGKGILIAQEYFLSSYYLKLPNARKAQAQNQAKARRRQIWKSRQKLENCIGPLSTFDSGHQKQPSYKMHSANLRKQLSRPDSALSAHVARQSHKALNESFVLIGTPLPSIIPDEQVKSKDSNEFKPLWQQEVLDDQGRRRLHGAFTGGFSAGYYNTVGSKEGWTPTATFRSSRKDKAKHAGATRVESSVTDFMDEEDLQDMRDNRTLQTTSSFNAVAERESTASTTERGPDRIQVIDDLFSLDSSAAPSDNVGVKLMKKLGWKEGHGSGSRVTLEQRDRILASYYPPHLPRPTVHVRSSARELGETAKQFTFPRPDTPLQEFHRKENNFGLGYVPHRNLNDALNQDSDQSNGSLRIPSKNMQTAKPALAVGFGLGALNDIEDDDLDVFAPSAGQGMDGLREAIEHGYGTQVVPTKRGNSSVPLAEVDLSPRPKGSSTWRDNTSVDPAFRVLETLSNTMSKVSLTEQNLIVPEGWKPDPRKIWREDAKFKHLVDSKSGTGINPLSADQRGFLLGESGVDDLISQFLQAKQQEISKGASAAGESSTDSQSSSATASIQVPYLDSNIAAAALNGFLPYAGDIPKQARYRSFLTAAESRSQYHPLPAPGQTIEQLNQELSDFSKAAALFKPMNTTMGSRFISASQDSTAPTTSAAEGGLLPRVQITPRNVVPDPVEKPSDPSSEVMTQAALAVQSNNFGRMTRTSQNIYPMRLLCKRFNVPDPHPGGPSDADRKQVGQDAWQAAGLSAMQAPERIEKAGAATNEANLSLLSTPSLANVGLGEDETQGRDVLTYQRPKMDIFEAIFGQTGVEDGEADEDSADERDASPIRTDLQAQVSSRPASDQTLQKQEIVPIAQDVHSRQEQSTGAIMPTFLSKSARQIGTGSIITKKKKNKQERKIVLTFADEDEEEPSEQLQRKRHKISRSQIEPSPKDGDENLADDHAWVEKPVLVHQTDTETTTVPSQPLKRATASDYM